MHAIYTLLSGRTVSMAVHLTPSQYSFHDIPWENPRMHLDCVRTIHILGRRTFNTLLNVYTSIFQAEEPLLLLSAIAQLEQRLDSAGGRAHTNRTHTHIPLSATTTLANTPIFKCDPSLHNLSLWHKGVSEIPS